MWMNTVLFTQKHPCHRVKKELNVVFNPSSMNWLSNYNVWTGRFVLVSVDFHSSKHRLSEIVSWPKITY